MEKKRITQENGDIFCWQFLTSSYTWKFSLVVQKGGENATRGSGYIEPVKSQSGSVLTHIYTRKVPEPCSVDDDLDSLKPRAVPKQGLFHYDLCCNYCCIHAPLAFPFPSCTLIFPATTPVFWDSSFLRDSAGTVPMEPDSFGIAPSTKLPAPCPFSRLTCPFPLSQIFLQPCLIGALLSFAFFGLPPCQSNAIRPGAGANPLLWLLLLTNPRPKILREPMEWEIPGARAEAERAKLPDCEGEGASI